MTLGTLLQFYAISIIKPCLDSLEIAPCGGRAVKHAVQIIRCLLGNSFSGSDSAGCFEEITHAHKVVIFSAIFAKLNGKVEQKCSRERIYVDVVVIIIAVVT